MELELISTTPIPHGENRVYTCGARRISVSRVFGTFEFFANGEAIQMVRDRRRLTWERVARAGLAYWG